MKDLLQFASESPWLAFFLVWLSAFFVAALVNTLTFRPFNRWMRSRNIAAKGWPPPHLDADGDFKPAPETEEN